MHLLEQAILIATHAHAGQVDKGGQPYILHPLSVMNRVHTIEQKIVAVLHDMIEDTDITLDQLQEAGFPQPILAAVNTLTRRPEESYEEYIERVSQNPLATVVKLADLTENMNLLRIPSPTPKDDQRIQRYQKAYQRLQSISE